MATANPQQKLLPSRNIFEGSWIINHNNSNTNIVKSLLFTPFVPGRWWLWQQALVGQTLPRTSGSVNCPCFEACKMKNTPGMAQSTYSRLDTVVVVVVLLKSCVFIFALLTVFLFGNYLKIKDHMWLKAEDYDYFADEFTFAEFVVNSLHLKRWKLTFSHTYNSA